MNGKLVTVFGGGGFVGRYVVQALIKAGARVRVVQRHPKQAFFLKGGANLGQIQFAAADVTRPETVAAALAGTDAVVNLVGSFDNMDAIQRAGAAHVAEAASQAGVAAFVHMSAIGADPQSPSAYGRSKGAGEDAVRAAFPKAVILRPSLIFGREDAFTNRFAQMIRALPIVPVMRSSARFQPVFVGDVARAVVVALTHPDRHGGHTCALGGPAVLSMGEINRWLAEATGHKRGFIDLPDEMSAAIVRFTGFLPGAPITWDQWLMLQSDNVVDPGQNGLAAFGIDPVSMHAVAPQWLVVYRRHGRFGARANAQ